VRQFGGVFVAADAWILGDVTLGEGTNVWYGCIVRGDLATITLGRGVNLQDGCIVHTDGDAPQSIEDGVVAGHAAILHGASIGRDTLVGIGARLLSGTVVGPECVIGAGTVLAERTVVPARSLVLGVPGRVVRAVTDDEVERTRRIAGRYLELAARHAAGGVPRRFSHGEGS
jgi:carbonic anhydrase/acetyltransferase-like protein (isoleucine patch superfamily)